MCYFPLLWISELFTHDFYLHVHHNTALMWPSGTTGTQRCSRRGGGGMGKGSQAPLALLVVLIKCPNNSKFSPLALGGGPREKPKFEMSTPLGQSWLRLWYYMYRYCRSDRGPAKHAAYHRLLELSRTIQFPHAVCGRR